MYSVIVGNIGTVYQGTDRKTAWETFDHYTKESKLGHGRGAGEPVTLYLDGEIADEYTPPEEAPEDE